MACGLGLGILLVCLAQAERARCLWTSAAQSSRDNRHVGYLDQDVRPRGLGGSPQNQVRQVFVSPRPFQSRGFSVAPAVQRGSGPGLSTRFYTQTPFQQAQNSAGPMQSSLVSNEDNVQPELQRTSVLFTAVSQNQQGPGEKSRTGAGSAQQATLAAVQPRPRSAASMFGPTGSSSSGSASLPSAAQEPSSVAAKSPSSYNQMGSVLFSPVGASPRGSHVRMQTYARAPARRASRRRSKAHRSPQTGTGSAGIPNFRIPAQVVPRSRAGGSGPATVYNIPQHLGGSPIRRFRDPAEQVKTQKPVQVLAPPHQQLAVYKPQRPAAHQDSKWSRVQLQHGS